MSSHLSVFQVSADAEELYRRILRSRPSMLAPYAAELGWSQSLAAEALESLIAARLVRETADGLVLVEHPRTALERLVGNEEARLDLRRRELGDARAAISRFTAEHRAAGSSGGWAVTQPAWEIVSQEMAVSMVEHALRSTSGVIRTCIRSLEVGSGLDDEAVRTGQAALAGGREQRAIYPIVALEDLSGRRWAQSWADVGEQQRVSESPPSEFAIFGDDVVLAVAEWGSTESDHIIIRNPMLIAAFTAMFDYAWELALPMPGVRVDTDEDRQLLTLLATGFKDEAIARYLGWGVRTVRRRVAKLMDELGADTRFQLGAAAQARGLLTAGRRTSSR
jgi:DNA-binding CsgD family transcriptional regulator